MSGRWRAFATLGASVLFGCGDGSAAAGSAKDLSVICSATNGFPGGNGGDVALLYSSVGKKDGASDDWNQRVELSGGLGGKPGAVKLGPSVAGGSRGLDGSLVVGKRNGRVDVEPSWPKREFEPESDFFVDAPYGVWPPIKASEFTLQADTVLELSCDLTIVADKVVIERGAILRVWKRDGAACEAVFGGASDLGHRPALDGGVLVVTANSIDLQGTIDVSGNRAVDSEGGDAGVVYLYGKSLTIGKYATILARGGRGADGVDETECGGS